MSSLIRALWRYGGVLLAPRTTVAALRPDEGQRDGLWLGLLYVLAVGTFGLIEAAVTLRATPNLGGVVMLLAAVGRSLVVPILVLVASETILGRRRAYRRGLYLVPLVLIASLAHELSVHGVDLPAFAPAVVGGLAAIALTWWTRREVAEEEVEA